MERLGLIGAPPGDRLAEACSRMPTVMAVVKCYPRSAREVVAGLKQYLEAGGDIDVFHTVPVVYKILQREHNKRAFNAVEAAVKTHRPKHDAEAPHLVHMVREMPDSGEVLQ
jgi:hypothetical protein